MQILCILDQCNLQEEDFANAMVLQKALTETNKCRKNVWKMIAVA